MVDAHASKFDNQTQSRQDSPCARIQFTCIVKSGLRYRRNGLTVQRIANHIDEGRLWYGCSGRILDFHENIQRPISKEPLLIDSDIELMKRFVALRIQQAVVEQWSAVEIPRFRAQRTEVNWRVGQSAAEQ